MAHTPGPWSVRVNRNDDLETCDLTICGDIFLIADINGPQYPHQRANARLIAAAPDLLAVASDASHFLNGMVEIARMIGLTVTSDWDRLFGTNDGFGLIDKIDAAIAKAEGAQE